MAILPDQTKPTYEQLLAENARLKARANGPKVAWAKDKDGNDRQDAINITWPGKRSRYLEVEELEYLIANGESIMEQLTEMMG